MSDWQLTGTVAPERLTPARLELHAAVQAVAAPGLALLPAREDASHGSLSWSDQLGGFVGEPLPPTSVRAGLALATLTLCVLDGAERRVGELALPGVALAQAVEWLSQTLKSLLHTEMEVTALDLPDFVLAQRPAGTPFRTRRESAELARYYANANRLLGQWATRAIPVRAWPHHFDIAVLLPGPGEGQSVGVGLSPGDSSYAEPYWYVTPWPYPDARSLPRLAGGGTWHTKGWVGAVLTGSQTTRASADAQRQQVEAFLESAIAALRSVLGPS